MLLQSSWTEIWMPKIWFVLAVWTRPQPGHSSCSNRISKCLLCCSQRDKQWQCQERWKCWDSRRVPEIHACRREFPLVHAVKENNLCLFGGVDDERPFSCIRYWNPRYQQSDYLWMKAQTVIWKEICLYIRNEYELKYSMEKGASSNGAGSLQMAGNYTSSMDTWLEWFDLTGQTEQL